MAPTQRVATVGNLDGQLLRQRLGGFVHGKPGLLPAPPLRLKRRLLHVPEIRDF